MQVTTMAEIENALGEMDPDTLREMAYRLALSHVGLCESTSRIGDCAHTTDEAIRDRIEGLERSKLISLLAPHAWLAVDIHHRLG
jgi:hypothetical protein